MKTARKLNRAPLLRPIPFRLTPIQVAGLVSAPVTSHQSPVTETICEEAQRITSGDRNKDYGHPLDNHQCTADLLTAWLRRKYGQGIPALTAEDVCMFNILQKCSRGGNAIKRDTLTDIAGFARNIEMIGDERARRTGAA